jgi:hypothetical protein
VKLLPNLAGLVLVSLLLTGCSATSAPAPTVTVTMPVSAATPTPTLRSAEAAPWDLHAVCAAEAGISTLEQWRRYQTSAGRLSSTQGDAINQGIAVQYLEMNEFGAPTSVQQEVTALAHASGTLDHPNVDLNSTAVRTARTGLSKACADSGLTIGIYAQGG